MNKSFVSDKKEVEIELGRTHAVEKGKSIETGVKNCS